MNRHLYLSYFIALLLMMGTSIPGMAQEAGDDAADSATATVESTTHEESDNDEFDFEETIESVAEAVEKFFESFEGDVEEVVKEAEVQYEKAMKDAEVRLEDSEEINRIVETSLKVAQDIVVQMNNNEIRIPEIRIPEIKLPPLAKIPFAPSLRSIKQDFSGEVVSSSNTYQFSASDDTEIHIDSEFSDITAVPSEDDSTITVLVEIAGGADTVEQAREILEAVDVDVEKDNGTVEIDVDMEKRDSKSYDSEEYMQMVSILIMVPVDTPLKIENEFGKTHVENVGGPVECENSYGPVLVRGSVGQLVIQNEFGETKVVNHSGDAHIRNEFGSTVVDGIIGNLVINSEYGAVTISGLQEEARVVANISFGDGKVLLPSTYRGSIDAASEWGSITAPFDLKRTEEMFAQSMRGSVAEGEGRLKLNSSFGGFEILMEENSADQ